MSTNHLWPLCSAPAKPMEENDKVDRDDEDNKKEEEDMDKKEEQDEEFFLQKFLK